MADNRNIIYSNDAVEEYNYLVEQRDSGEEALENYTDDDLWELAYENIEMHLEDEIGNLNVEPGGNIILVGKLRRWDGTYSVSKDLGTTNIGKAIPRAMACFGGQNTFEIYVEDGRMYLSQTGHDNPVNPSVMEFRILKKGVDFNDLEASEYEKNSTSPAKTVAKVYGWEVA